MQLGAQRGGFGAAQTRCGNRLAQQHRLAARQRRQQVPGRLRPLAVQQEIGIGHSGVSVGRLAQALAPGSVGSIGLAGAFFQLGQRDAQPGPGGRRGLGLQQALQHRPGAGQVTAQRQVFGQAGVGIGLHPQLTHRFASLVRQVIAALHPVQRGQQQPGLGQAGLTLHQALQAQHGAVEFMQVLLSLGQGQQHRRWRGGGLVGALPGRQPRQRAAGRAGVTLAPASLDQIPGLSRRHQRIAAAADPGLRRKPLDDLAVGLRQQRCGPGWQGHSQQTRSQQAGTEQSGTACTDSQQACTALAGQHRGRHRPVHQPEPTPPPPARWCRWWAAPRR